jgi:hypothetical protein
MRYSRKWSKPNNSPYSNPKVWKQMPAKFNMKYETMGKKWFELYKQNNI